MNKHSIQPMVNINRNVQKLFIFWKANYTSIELYKRHHILVFPLRSGTSAQLTPPLSQHFKQDE